MKLQICKIAEVYTENDYPEKRQFVIIKKGLVTTKVLFERNKDFDFRNFKDHDFQNNERFNRETAERILRFLVDRNKLNVVLEKKI